MKHYFQTRWKFLLPTALVGLIVGYFTTFSGAFAVLMGIFMPFMMGNGIYYVLVEKENHIIATWRTLKYMVAFFVPIIIYSIATYQP